MVDYVSSSDSELEEERPSGAPVDAQQMIEASRRKRFKSAFPDKEDDLVHDVGSLAAFDYHPVDAARLRRERDAYLAEVARDNTQLLFNRIFTQPAVKTPDGVFAELPRRLVAVPREKPMPKPKPATKWDEFAKIKGIQKRKRSAKEWNEEREDYVPRFGKKSAKNDPMADWVMELPANAADDYDPRAESKASRKKALAKQKAQEESNKNRARARGQRKMAGSASTALLTGGKRLDRSAVREQVTKTLQQTTEATASAGVFVDGKERAKNHVKINKNKHVRERAPGTDSERQARVLDRVLQKQSAPDVILEKAVARHRLKEKQETAQNPTKKFGKAKGKGKGKGKK